MLTYCPVALPPHQDGFKFKVAYPDTKPSEAGIHEFRPPCFVRATAGPETSEVQHNVCVYATPTIPGQCRVFSFQVGRLPRLCLLCLLPPPPPELLFHRREIPHCFLRRHRRLLQSRDRCSRCPWHSLG